MKNGKIVNEVLSDVRPTLRQRNHRYPSKQ